MTDNRAELEYYADLLKPVGKPKVKHTPDFWDKRAVTWDSELKEEGGRKKRSDIRISETVRYLKEQNILMPDTRLIDIGCGLGLFTTEFAKTAAYSLGIDLSPEMTRRAEAYAEDEGVSGAEFEACDFVNIDIDGKNWRGAFDLVFASITPVAGNPAGWKKMTDMSRKYCFNSTFVHSDVSLENQLARDVYKRPVNNPRDSRGFYAMFNTLWLWGYFPVVTYHREAADEYLKPDRTMAVKLDERFNPYASEEETERIYEYLKSICGPDGTYHYTAEWIYAWTLWDVRKCVPRSFAR